MKIINTISWVAAIGVAASLAMIMPAFAQTSANAGSAEQWCVGMRAGHGGHARGGMAPGDFWYGERGER